MLRYIGDRHNVVQENEYGYNTKEHMPSDWWFYMNVPKLMPHIDRGDPIVTPVGINGGIYINDAPCMPKVTPVRPSQNYLYIKRFYNTDLSFKGNPIPKNTRFLVQFTDANILVYNISDKL